MAPLAFFIKRKTRPPLSLSILGWVFLLALLGATLFQNLFSASLDYISSTTQLAILNLFPAFTYSLSASRHETPELNRLRGIGKLSGTVISVSGTLTMIFWHGNVAQTFMGNSGNWILGYIFATLGILSLSTWLMLQEPMTRRYSAELSITALMYFFGTLQTCVLVAFVSQNLLEWKLKWDLELLNMVFGRCQNLHFHLVRSSEGHPLRRSFCSVDTDFHSYHGCSIPRPGNGYRKLQCILLGVHFKGTETGQGSVNGTINIQKINF